MSSQQPTLNLAYNRPPKKAKPAPALDWAATHGPVSGALSATTGAGAIALLGAAADMPTGWPMAVGVAGAIGHGIGHSLYRRFTGRTLVTRAASWLLAGGWTTWAIASGPLTWTAAGTLATLGVAIGSMASSAAAHEEAAEEERMTAEAKALVAEFDAKRRAVANEWAERILRVTGIQVQVFAVQFWDNGNGFSLAAEMPGGRATWTQIGAASRALAQDARLPRGCTIHVEEGDVQGRVVLDVATVNVMGKTVTYPDDYSALSILTGIPWMLLPTGDDATVFLREACALILGPPGSGKSTFLDAVIAGFARCTDVLTWAIDLKAGAIGRPWARAWLEAQGHKAPSSGQQRPPADTRPGLDWIASTPEEALLMTRASLAINAARQDGYQDLMDAADTTLLPVSHQIPQIELIIDEGAELLSASTSGDPVMKELQANVKKIMRTTRAMGERLVLTAVDGNVSAIGSTEVRKFSPVGVALTSGENATSNVNKLFPSNKVDSSQLNEKGAGVIGQAGADGFAATEGKGWKTSPSMARDCTIATSARRPVLDEVSATAAGAVYAQRWSAERAGWLWGADKYRVPSVNAMPVEDDAEDATSAPRPERRPPAGGGLNLSYMRREPAGMPRDEADAVVERFMREIDEQYGTTDEPSVGLAKERKQPESAVDERRALVRRLVRDAGPDGVDTSEIWPVLDAHFGDQWDRSVVTTWMGDDVRAGLMHRPRKGRYVHGPAPEQAGE